MIRTAGPTVRGHVTFTTTDDAGDVVAVVEADNAFTDSYASFIAQLIGSGGSPAMPATHVQLGTGTGDTSHTATSVSGGGTKKGLTSLVYTAPLTVTATAYWSSGEAGFVGHSAGLWGGTAGATLMAIALVDFTKQAGFNLTVTWQLVFVGA
jgi:hypothetical protein